MLPKIIIFCISGVIWVVCLLSVCLLGCVFLCLLPFCAFWAWGLLGPGCLLLVLGRFLVPAGGHLGHFLLHVGHFFLGLGVGFAFVLLCPALIFYRKLLSPIGQVSMDDKNYL